MRFVSTNWTGQTGTSSKVKDKYYSTGLKIYTMYIGMLATITVVLSEQGE